MLMMFDCCEECDYWEDQIDIHIDNQIKEYKLINIAKKDSKETKLLMIKPFSKNTERSDIVLKKEFYRDGNDQVIAKVGTTSSQK